MPRFLLLTEPIIRGQDLDGLLRLTELKDYVEHILSWQPPPHLSPDQVEEDQAELWDILHWVNLARTYLWKKYGLQEGDFMMRDGRVAIGPRRN